MRFLADENLAQETVEALRGRGHDVAYVRTDAPGSSDDEVLRRASAESRLVITSDKDFGELAFRWGLAAGSGIILLRARGLPETRTAAVVAALDVRDDWTGQFAVIENGRVRMTPLPRLD